jgi:hypothetical protein
MALDCWMVQLWEGDQTEWVEWVAWWCNLVPPEVNNACTWNATEHSHPTIHRTTTLLHSHLTVQVTLSTTITPIQYHSYSIKELP